MNGIKTDLLQNLVVQGFRASKRPPEYYEWINTGLVDLTNEFFGTRECGMEGFPAELNEIYGTDRFNNLFKRWTVDYLHKLFDCIYDASAAGREVLLEKNPLNVFAVERFKRLYGTEVPVKWSRGSGFSGKSLLLFFRTFSVLWISLKNGIVFGGRKNYKVLRECLWGLTQLGSYFHDDFLVDGEKLKKDELLLFTRGLPEPRRIQAYKDAAGSGYAHFDLRKAKISADALFMEILPKYLSGGVCKLARHINNPCFSYYYSVFSYFCVFAVPYERLFSNYDIHAELGHAYFSAVHIPESIVCQSHGAKYCLMHWSDNTVNANKYISSFLACDKYISWGEAHYRGVEGPASIMEYTGYVFKGFINKVKAQRGAVRREMGIPDGVFLAVFFDESFGDDVKMTAEHFLNFWDTALKTASTGIHVAIKSKELDRAQNLGPGLKAEFERIYSGLRRLPNFTLVDEFKWSFIEAIGVSDVVVTQGMTSSSTIALICGIQGLYLDQAAYDHPFSRNYKGILVFDNSDTMVNTIVKISRNEVNPLSKIPAAVLNGYDEYRDDLSFERFQKAVLN